MGIVGTFADDTITRLRPTTRDSRGTPVFDWSNPDALTIHGCSVQPSATRLDLDGRVLGITDGLTVYAPAGADVIAGDRVQWQGDTYTLDGVPRAWTSPTGNRSHLQLNLKRWSG